MNKFGGENIPSSYVETMNEEYKTRRLQFDDREIIITIYDKKKYDKFDKDINGLIFVYDVTNKKSFEAMKVMIDKIKSDIDNNDNLPIIMVLGNKLDQNDKRVISFDDGQEFCYKNDIPLFYQISMKNDSGMLSQSILRMVSKANLQSIKMNAIYRMKRKKRQQKLFIGAGILVIVVGAFGAYYYYNKYFDNNKVIVAQKE